MHKKGPSNQWRSQHGKKIAHRTWLGAFIHAWQLNHLRRRRGEAAREPYPCWWGQWYQEGRRAAKHWHVGRRKVQCSGEAADPAMK